MTVKLITMVLSVMFLVALTACSDDSDGAGVSTVQTQAAAPVVKKEASPVAAVVKASEKDDDEKHDEDEDHDEDETHDHDEDEHGMAIHVIGISTGSTSFQLQLMHEGHSDYTSTNNVPVVVN